MRILMTTDPLGDVWTYSMVLAGQLRRYGVEVVLASIGGELTGRQRAEAAALDNVRLHVSTLKLEWMDEPWSDVAEAGDWLLELAQWYRPELVHLNGYAHATLPWQGPVVVVGHSCVLSWWRACKDEPPPSKYDAYRRVVASAIVAADRLIAPSRAMLRALERHYGPLPPKAQCIYNGRDGRAFLPREKKPVIFSVGQLSDEARNVATLAYLADELPWPIRIACPTLGLQCQGHADDGAAELLLGRLSPEEVADEMSAAAIYALPARYEPFGLSVLEAALAGCALVLGDIESLREIWTGCAEFVAPDDPADLRRSLNDLISRPERRGQLALQARRRAAQFTPQRMAGEYVDVYKEVLRRYRQRQTNADRELAELAALQGFPSGSGRAGK